MFDFKPNIIIFFNATTEYVGDLFNLSKDNATYNWANLVPAIRYLANLTTEYTKGGIPLATQTIVGYNQNGGSNSAQGEGYTKIENNTIYWYVEVVGGISIFSYNASGNQLNGLNSTYYYIAF